MQHKTLQSIREATLCSPFEGDLWLVGGAVRDEMLGIEHSGDLDFVTRGSSGELAELLYSTGISDIAPVTYPRFGTAMVQVAGVGVEIVTARRESYEEQSRKPTVESATYEEDALRRDFTVNTLMRNLHGGELWDPLGSGLNDLKSKILRTPIDPVLTFRDDPLRMLRAVRFRWKLGFEPDSNLYDAIRSSRGRLRIVSLERVRDELVKMLEHPTASDALQELMDLGIMEMFVPEFLPMIGCEQGNYHHLDVWNHTLLVLRNAGSRDLILSLGALLHDVGKPFTRTVDAEGHTRFFGHEAVGERMSRDILRRLKFSSREVDEVSALVKNHMRLGSSPVFTHSAARRLLRDMGDQTERLLDLVEADANGLKRGVRVMDLSEIRSRLDEVRKATPPDKLESPLSGLQIMELAGLAPGPEVGRLKQMLTEKVLEGELAPSDTEAAKNFLKSHLSG